MGDWFRNNFHKSSLIAGLFLLLLAIFWHFILSPFILRLPADFFFSADLVSVDNFYNDELQEFEGEQYSKTVYLYEATEASHDEVLVNNIFNVQTVGGDEIINIERQYKIDRYTGAHRDKELPASNPGYLFAPRNLRPGETFTYWHVNYDNPAEMSFLEEESLYGLRTLKYEADYEGEVVDQTENLTWLPGVGEEYGIRLEPYLEVWIEPVTGQLVKYRDTTIAYYYDLATGEYIKPWNKFSNTFREDSVISNVRRLEVARGLHNLSRLYLPIIFLVFSLVLLFLSIKPLAEYLRRSWIAKYTPSLMGAFVVASAVAVLTAWFLHDADFLILRSGGPSTNPLTAILFLVAGFGTFCIRFRKALTPVVGTVLILASLIQLLGLYGIIDFSLDRVLFSYWVVEFSSRTAAFTALSFFLLGCAFIANSFKVLSKYFVAEILTIIVFLLSTLSFISYLLIPSWLLSLTLFAQVSFYTSLLMTLLSAGFFWKIRRYTEKENEIGVESTLVLVALLGLTMFFTVGSTALVENAIKEQAEEKFEAAVAFNTALIQDRLDIYINTLEGVEALLSASEEVTRDEWKSYVDALNLQGNYPGVQGIGYSVFIEPEDLQGHIESVRAQGFPEYTVRPEGDREIYSSIIYLEPFDERNRQAFGYDMFQQSIRRFAMSRARDTGLPNISGVITLVQEIDEDVQAGFLIYIPHYSVLNAESVEDRRESIIGYAYSPFRARNFVEGIIGVDGVEEVGLRIHDGILYSEDRELYNDNEKKGIDLVLSRFVDSRTFFVAGRAWTLTFSSTPYYGETFIYNLLPIIILLVGILISVMIAMTFYTLLSSRRRAQVYADAVTADLRTEKAKDEAMLSSIGEGLVAVDREGKIMLVNQVFTDILGWTPEEAIGEYFWDIVKVLDRSGNALNVEDRLVKNVLSSGKSSSITVGDGYEYVRKDGSSVAVSVTASPIKEGAKLLGAVQVFNDATKEKEIDASKTEFISLASHQLRTPLTAMRWNLELILEGLEDGSIPEEYKKSLIELDKANKNLINLVQALLSTSRIDLGTFQISPVEIDAREFLARAIIDYEQLAKRREVDFDTNFEKAPKTIFADPQLLLIIIQNLLSNAIKYTGKGGSVMFKFFENSDGSWQFEIEDSGIGIPESQQGDVFAKLFRADNVKGQDFEGTGLGLYILKSIVDTAGGKVYFVSKEGVGTKFTVIFPPSGMAEKRGEKKLEA